MLTHSSNTVVKFHLISRFFRFLAPFVLETYTSLRLATPHFVRITQDSFALHKFQARCTNGAKKLKIPQDTMNFTTVFELWVNIELCILLPNL